MHHRILTLSCAGCLLVAGTVAAGHCAPVASPGAQTYYAASLPLGLFGWWAGDGNVQDMTRHNPARLYNGADFAPGHVGQGFHFDGEGAYVKVIPIATEMDSAAGFSVELWVNPARLDQQTPLVGWGSADKPGVMLWIGIGDGPGDGRLGADVRDTLGMSHPLASDPGTVKTNAWQHVALTYSAETGMARLYCNGEPVAVHNIGMVKPNTDLDLYLGKHPAINNGQTLFKGVLDEVSVYKRALTATEVQAIYTAATAGKTLDLDALAWPNTGLTADQLKAAQEQLYTDRLRSYRDADKNTLTFTSFIDGSDYVHLKGSSLWYVHRDWALPGKNDGNNYPTQVDLQDWMPDWTGNTSNKYDKLDPPLAATGKIRMTINVLRGGGTVTVPQLSGPNTNYEAFLLIDDDANLGPHWYSFSVTWSVAPE